MNELPSDNSTPALPEESTSGPRMFCGVLMLWTPEMEAEAERRRLSPTELEKRLNKRLAGSPLKSLVMSSLGFSTGDESAISLDQQEAGTQADGAQTGAQQKQ